MIFINYNVVTKIATITSNGEEITWSKQMDNIDSVVISPSQQHVTFKFIKKSESDSSSVIIRPDDKKVDYAFTTNALYLYTEDQYSV